MDDDRDHAVSTRLRPLDEADTPDLWPLILERSHGEGTRIRHRHGVRVAVGAAAVVLVAAVGVATWPGGGDRDTQVVVGDPGTTTTSPEARPSDDTSREVSTTELPLLDRAIALDLLALHPNGGQIAVLDLEDRVLRSSQRGGDFPLGAVSGAVISPTGDALVWINNEIFAFPDADFSRAPTVIGPEIGRDVSLHLPGIAAEQHVRPAADGTEVWVVMRAGIIVGDDTLVERIALRSGTTTLSTSIPGVDARPAVGAGTNLLLNARDANDTASVLVMDEHGSVTDLGPGGAIAAFDDRAAVLRPNGDLVIIGVDGTDEVTIERPDQGSRWDLTGGMPTPGLSPPARRVTADGRLLMARSSGLDRNGVATAQSFYSVDMVDGTVERIAEVEGSPFATWSRTGNDIVLLRERTVSVLSLATPDDAPRVVATLPPDTWLFAAG